MKITKCFVVTFLMAIVIANVGPGLQEQVLAAEFKFNAGHPYDDQHPTHKSFLNYAKVVRERSGGRIEISVIGGGALGHLDDMLNQMRLGALAINPVNPTTMAKANPQLMYDELPYLYSNLDVAMDAHRGDLGDVVKSIMYKDGVKMLNFTLPIGFRNFTNNVRPIIKPADLKGLKIRIAESKIRSEAFQLLGISPTPMTFGELYSALRLKTVDGQENPLSIIYTSRFYEVQKYLSLSGHIFNSGGLGFSRPIWDKLPKDVQELLQKAANDCGKFDLDVFIEAETEALSKLKKTGMEIVTEVDKTPFKEAMSPLYKKWGEIIGSDIRAALTKYTGTKFD